MNHNNMAGLALDMWREVLIRLPGECLIRSRAVCKGFRAVIDDPGFIRSHTKNWSSSSSSVVIRNYGPKIAPKSAGSSCCYSVDLEGLIGVSNGHQAMAATPLELDFLSNSPGARFAWPVAACNGLVLTQNPPLLTIWNPLTRERLELPPFSNSYAPAFGLGYDGATDDYKAVVILRNRETHVYSLRSNTWRRIIDCPSCPEDGPGVFAAGGCLYWLSSDDDSNEYSKIIVTLDLRTETYSLLQKPPRTRMWNERLSYTWLVVLGGCLVLCESGFGASYLDVWKDSNSSWIKLFSIDGKKQQQQLNWMGYLRPVAFAMKGRLVFLQDGYNRFFLFDVLDHDDDDSHTKCVGIHGPQLYWDAQQMFVGTLFRLLHNNNNNNNNNNNANIVGTTAAAAAAGGGVRATTTTSSTDDTTITSSKKRKITTTSCTSTTTTSKKRRRKTSTCTKKKTKKRKRSADDEEDDDCTKTTKKKKKQKPAELFFCVRDANPKNIGACLAKKGSGPVLEGGPCGKSDEYGLFRQRAREETKGFDYPKPGVNIGARVPTKDNGEPVRFAKLALDKYNQTHKKAFVFDRVVYASFIPSCYRTYLITFRIKHNGENVPDVFHAEVRHRPWEVEVLLVRPRPH